MKKGVLCWCAALVLLCGALIYFNHPDTPGVAGMGPREMASAGQDDVPRGHGVGERLEDFSITCMDESRFTLSGERGRVTVINLWATWCTPCVNELPHFDRLQAEYGEGVKVLAVHSDLITDSPREYLAGYDYDIAFAVDESGEVISLVGGSVMLPQTVVVDGEGIVTYNQVGSVTYEALEQLVQSAGARRP